MSTQPGAVIHSSRWTLFPVVSAALALIGCNDHSEQPSAALSWARPGATMVVEVTGHDFEWHYRFAGTDRSLGTADDLLAEGDLHLPVGARAELLLESQDYIYTFSLPHAGVHEIAVPDMTFTVLVDAEIEGTFELLGDQLCGYAHGGLIKRLIVEPESRFRAWIEAGGTSGS